MTEVPTVGRWLRSRSDPLRVLQFICPTGLYGAEMWILALVRNLDSKLVESELAVTREGPGQDLELVSRFRALGLPAHEIAMSSRFDLAAISKLAELLRDRRIDVIHTHGYKSDLLGFMAARRTGTKVLATPHGFGHGLSLKLKLFKWLDHLALRRADLVAPLSEELYGEMTRIGVRGDRNRFILNGVDLTEIEPRRADERGPGPRKVIYVGRMDSNKNLGDLLTAFDLLSRQLPDVVLTLVGDGPSRPELAAQCQTLSCAQRVEFLGYRTDRLDLVRDADLFAMTSLSEGIPRCLMEAMALGVPVAAYRNAGVECLVQDGETGLLAELGDVQSLQECLRQLLEERGLAARIGLAGRDYVVNRYSARRMALQYEDSYRELGRRFPTRTPT